MLPRSPAPSLIESGDQAVGVLRRARMAQSMKRSVASP
jgi:hypothetical protein